jgi:hypothetical protein
MSNTRLVALGMLLGMLTFGQAKREYSARGTVRNTQTREPVQDALVSIAMMPTASQTRDPFSGVPWDPHAQEVLSGPGGEFRFEGLPAGLYVYEAQKPGFVLYRGSFTLPEASPNASVQVDLIPDPPHPTFKIRGKVQGYLTPGGVKFELLRGAGRADQSRTLFDVHTGEFEILDVAPGEYRLRATQDKMRGEVKVNVGRADVTGLSIPLLASPTVRGIMRSVGGRADAIRYPNPCNVNLSQDWPPYPDAVYVPRWQPDGHFSLEILAQPNSGVLPGEYQVHFLCFGAYVQSASFGGVDLLINPVVRISADSPPPSMEIDYTPGGGNLQAIFTDPVLPFDAVLLVPDFPASNGPELQKVTANGFFEALGSQDRFQFSNLTPGDYTIYTFPKFENVEFRNPAFLQALSGGIRVHIEDGEIAELRVTGTSTSTVRRVPLN